MVALMQAGRAAEIPAHGERLLHVNANDWEARYVLSWSLITLGRGLDVPGLWTGQDREIPMLHDMGRMCGQANQWEAACACFLRSSEGSGSGPDHAIEFSVALAQCGRFQEAVQLLEDNERVASPESHTWAVLRFHRAKLLLLQGDYKKGLELYESRTTLEAQSPGEPFRAVPTWQGEPLQGRQLLLRTEQGLGDSIMAIRFARKAAAAGAEVLVEAAGPISSILATAEGVARVLAPKEQVPPGTLQSPILSLPFHLGLEGLEVNPEGPYLRVPDLVPDEAALSSALNACPPGLKIGLVWRGNSSHVRDNERSLSADQLLPLKGVPGVQWISLQWGTAASLPFPMLNLERYLTGFANLSFALSHLDGLISVDTAAAHLAGALGKPCWLMLPHLPDWRWGLEGSTTAWYPKHRLWRQKSPGDWGGVAKSLVEGLRNGTFTTGP
jgi:hypothetical protein